MLMVIVKQDKGAVNGVSETVAASGETPKPALTIQLPAFRDPCDLVPHSAQWLLAGFGEWVDNECNDAMHSLRSAGWSLADVNTCAIFTAQRENITLENSPFEDEAKGFPNLASLSSGALDTMEEFFFFHLEKAQHEWRLSSLDFFHHMTNEFLPVEWFDEERQSQFEALWPQYLAASPYNQKSWDESGLGVDALITELLSGHAPCPWFAGQEPTSAQGFVSEFGSWLTATGLREKDFPTIPAVSSGDLARMKAQGITPANVLLLIEDEDDPQDTPVRFVCADPRCFEQWGRLCGYWRSFLSCSTRSKVWAAWLETEEETE